MEFSAADDGRIGLKVELQSKAHDTLGRTAGILCVSFGGYFPQAKRVEHAEARFPQDTFEVLGELPGASHRSHAYSGSAHPVVSASRL